MILNVAYTHNKDDNKQGNKKTDDDGGGKEVHKSTCSC